MSIEQSVGLVVLVNMPDLGLVALLQRRGKRNYEEGGKRESWPGGCQVTVHGKLKAEDENSFLAALVREAKEELGPVAAKMILDQAAVSGCLVQVYQLNEEKKQVVTYALRMDPAFIKQIRFSPSTGGLELISRKEAKGIMNLRSFRKEDGVRDSAVIVMFPDERVALEMAFAVVAPVNTPP